MSSGARSRSSSARTTACSCSTSANDQSLGNRAYAADKYAASKDRRYRRIINDNNLPYGYRHEATGFWVRRALGCSSGAPLENLALLSPVYTLRAVPGATALCWKV